MTKVTEKYNMDEIFKEASDKEASEVLIYNGVVFFTVHGRLHSSESGFEKSKTLAKYSNAVILGFLTNQQTEELSNNGVLRFHYQTPEGSFKVVIKREEQDKSLTLSAIRN